MTGLLCFWYQCVLTIEIDFNYIYTHMKLHGWTGTNRLYHPLQNTFFKPCISPIILACVDFFEYKYHILLVSLFIWKLVSRFKKPEWTSISVYCRTRIYQSVLVGIDTLCLRYQSDINIYICMYYIMHLLHKTCICMYIHIYIYVYYICMLIHKFITYICIYIHKIDCTGYRTNWPDSWYEPVL